MTDEDLQRFQKAKNAYLAGALDVWASILENNPEMKSAVIEEMKEIALLLKKSAGIIIWEDEKKKLSN